MPARHAETREAARREGPVKRRPASRRPKKFRPSASSGRMRWRRWGRRPCTNGLDPGAPGERYQVVVHVQAAVLAHPDQPGQSVLDDGAHVPAGTSRRLACDASRVVMRHDAAGRVVGIGARTRTISPALRRALLHRNPGCRFPGRLVRVGAGSPRAPLGAGWAHDALQSRPAVPASPSRGPRGGLSRRATGRWGSAVPMAGRP